MSHAAVEKHFVTCTMPNDDQFSIKYTNDGGRFNVESFTLNEKNIMNMMTEPLRLNRSWGVYATLVRYPENQYTTQIYFGYNKATIQKTNSSYVKEVEINCVSQKAGSGAGQPNKQWYE